MKRPLRQISIVSLLVLLCGLTLPATVRAEEHVLLGMEKQEDVSSTKLTLNFSSLPPFEIKHSGQRLDLLLSATEISPNLLKLPEDETVVRILLAEKEGELLVSTLLRRPPKQVASETLHNPDRLVLNLFWQGDDNTRTAVAFRIADMPPRKTGHRALKAAEKSPWDGHWMQFFSDYRSYWNLNIPLTYSQPTLAPLIDDQQSPLLLMQMYAKEKLWLSVLSEANKINDAQLRAGYLYRLLMAEAQIRSGSVDIGLARLEQLADEQGAQQQRVEYLTALGQALSGQPFLAQLSLQGLLDSLSLDHPLAAPVYLLDAELALATKRNKAALSRLQTVNLDWPEELRTVIALRTADAKAGTGEQQDALQTYRDLLPEEGLYESYWFSCNRAAFAAYQNHDYKLARELYTRLGVAMKDQPQEDMIMFAAAASAYLSGDETWGLIGLQKTVLEQPTSEGKSRAQLMLVDHQVISNGDLGLAEAALEYGKLGKNAFTQQVRDEASFKQALAQYLLGDHADSVANLMRFRREFSSSPLRREADLLLLKQLPKVFAQLLDQQRELDAVVLVEQNRRLLLHGGYDREFLRNLGDAFERLGLYARATRVFLYMLDEAQDDAQRQSVYLPLVRSYLKRGEYASVSEYAGDYLEQYPHGEDAGALFGLLLDAFSAQGRNEEMLAWLGRKDRPSSPELEVRAAHIYWRQNRPKEVVARLEAARSGNAQLPVKEMALLGEAYYQLDDLQNAEKIFRQLKNTPETLSQVRYRRAQILLRQGERSAALKLLGQLVDEDGQSAWGKLAQDLLIQERS